MIDNFHDYTVAIYQHKQGDMNSYRDFETYDFLRFLFKDCFGGYNEFRAIKSDNSEKPIQIFHSSFEVPRALFKKLIELDSKGYNIYFGHATRKEEKGTKDAIQKVSALPVDIDIKLGESKEMLEQQLNRRIEETSLIPSKIIDSGNGFHLYFKLDKNYTIHSEEDRLQIEGKIRWLAKMFGGDNICDITRLMRLPGFNNNKNPQEPKRCSVIQSNEDALYKLSDFGTISEPKTTIDRITIGELPNEIPSRFFEILEKNPKLNLTWLGQRVDLSDQSGSGYDFSLASILVRLEFSNEEIAKILKESKYEKAQPRTIEYLERTISKARSGYDECKDIKFIAKPSKLGLSEISLKSDDFKDCKIEYLIDDFLPKNTLMLMTGSYGSGKSYFCLALAKKLIAEGHTVVICDLDMPKHIIQGRLEDSGLLEHLGTKLHYIHSTNFPFKIEAKNENWTEFKQLIEAENEAIVIFDNLKELYPVGEDLNDDRRAIAVMNELKDIRDMLNTVILLHHVSKDGSSKHPFKNSGSIADTVDVAYVLERTDNECRLRSFKSRIPIKENVKFTLESDFSLHTKETEQEKDDTDKMLMIYEYMREAQDKDTGFLQKQIVEDLTGKVSRDKVRDMLLMGEDILWTKTPGVKNSHIYKPIELNSQNSKKVPIYALKKLGILESEEDIASIQEESPLESQLGENLRS